LGESASSRHNRRKIIIVVDDPGKYIGARLRMPQTVTAVRAGGQQ
jgi:hypothetical protein